MMEPNKEKLVRQFAEAFVQDVQDSERIQEAFDNLIQKPPSQAGIVIHAVKEDLGRELQGDFSIVVFPKTRALFRAAIKEETEARGKQKAGMAWITGVLSIAVPAITSTATAIYTTKMETEVQKDIAKLEAAQQAREAEAARLAAEARIKEAEAAMKLAEQQNVPSLQSASGMEISSSPRRVPGWVLPVGIAAAVIFLGYAALRNFGGPAGKRHSRKAAK